MQQFINRARFMASSLSNLVNNLSEGIHKIKCKYGHHDKRCKTCSSKYKNCECCKKNCHHRFDEKLKKRFF